jgi:hypothetical protein
MLDICEESSGNFEESKIVTLLEDIDNTEGPWDHFVSQDRSQESIQESALPSERDNFNK